MTTDLKKLARQCKRAAIALDDALEALAAARNELRQQNIPMAVRYVRAEEPADCHTTYREGDIILDMDDDDGYLECAVHDLYYDIPVALHAYARWLAGQECHLQFDYEKQYDTARYSIRKGKAPEKPLTKRKGKGE
jgi:hypothetical protein